MTTTSSTFGAVSASATDAANAEIETYKFSLREAVNEMLRHQLTGSREGMSALQNLCDTVDDFVDDSSSESPISSSQLGLLDPEGDSNNRCEKKNDSSPIRQACDVEACKAEAQERFALICDAVSASYGGIAAGKFVTDFGKHTHQAMAAGASNCAALIRKNESRN